MPDPLSIFASTLAITDATKKTIQACTNYINHAKNAPSELQLVVEDLEDLNVTIAKVDELAKTSWSSNGLRPQFEEWSTPISRLGTHAQALETTIAQQFNMKYGRFNEIIFRSTWPMIWRSIKSLMGKIDKEKGKLQLATAIEGAGMCHKVYMLMEQRLPPDLLREPDEDTIAWEHSAPQSESFFFEKVKSTLGWSSVDYELPALRDSHQRALETCVEGSCNAFLASETYTKWKNRQVPGPSLLFCSGPAASGKTILCAQIVQDLQLLKHNSRSLYGVAYAYSEGTAISLSLILRFWIMQLAIQSRRIPSHPNPTTHQENTLQNLERGTTDVGCLVELFLGLLPHYKRTFLILDGIDTWEPDFAWSANPPFNQTILQILQNTDANVSVALFGRTKAEDIGFQTLSDVTVKLMKVDPRSQNLRPYVTFKVTRMFKDLGVEHPEEDSGPNDASLYFPVTSRRFEIQKAVVAAADGLFLAVDMFIDSIMKVIREGGDLDAHLREITENSEIMMQRDEEIMKQKRIGEREDVVAAGASRAEVSGAGPHGEDDILPMRKR